MFFNCFNKVQINVLKSRAAYFRCPCQFPHHFLHPPSCVFSWSLRWLGRIVTVVRTEVSQRLWEPRLTLALVLYSSGGTTIVKIFFPKKNMSSWKIIKKFNDLENVRWSFILSVFRNLNKPNYYYFNLGNLLRNAGYWEEETVVLTKTTVNDKLFHLNVFFFCSNELIRPSGTADFNLHSLSLWLAYTLG